MSVRRQRLASKIKNAGKLPNAPKYGCEAIFVSAHVEDTNLSTITIYGEEHRWIRKHESVGSMSAGDLLSVEWSDALPMTIVGVIVGDTTLAEV